MGQGLCKSKKYNKHAPPRISRQELQITPSRLPNIPPSDLKIIRAVIQSTCIICDFKEKPQVFEFLQKDLPLFQDVTLEDGGHQHTTLLYLNKDDKILEKIVLWDKTREQCNSILEEAGFRKGSPSDPTPIDTNELLNKASCPF